MRAKIPIFLTLGLLLVGGWLVACTAEEASCPEPTACPDCPEATACPTCPTPEPCPDCPSSVEAPFEALWLASGHADAAAEAFIHWDEEDPAEVPVTCAKCHSTYGYQDFLGADGSPAGTIDSPAALGSVITCVACHNEATQMLSSVVFPSGLEMTGLGDEARCVQCHQGRESTVSVNDKLAELNLTDDPDTVSADLGFRNIHYYAAAATQFGTWAMGGYEYPDKAYDVKFAHVEGMDTCVDCHNSHTLELDIETCVTCHEGAAKESLKNIRTKGSAVDYDGDGDTDEGIYFEIETLQEMLYAAIRAYAKDVAGTAIVYDADVYPYFLADANENGQMDEGEERYVAWTGRLLKAAYNYHVSMKDPGAFAHGGKYIIELLYDSTEDLNTQLSDPIDLSVAHRIDAGHFASSQMPFRDWDADGEVPATCAKCHTGVGLPMFLKNGATIAVEPTSSFRCTTCHDTTTFEPLAVASVTFPSGASVDSGDAGSNLCLNCHQGRESTVSVDRAIGTLATDEVTSTLRFRNVHYYAAGATLFGSEAQGAYQYAGKEYVGPNTHAEGYTVCTSCHGEHSLTIKTDECKVCHGSTEPDAFRMASPDYDGDGDLDEGLSGEIATLHEALYAAIQTYATEVAEAPIIYDGHTYPYFFNDLNGNGTLDPDEGTRDNGFSSWSPRLLRAGYNYQYVAKDPGAFAHNGKYIVQILYDSISDLGGDVTGMERP